MTSSTEKLQKDLEFKLVVKEPIQNPIYRPTNKVAGVRLNHDGIRELSTYR